MKKVNFLLVAISFVILSSCTDAEREKYTNFGNSFKVEMYSGGQLVRTWTTTGKVSSEEGSDGYFFKDSATGKLVEIAGDIVITNVD